MTPRDSPKKYLAAAQYLDQEFMTGIAPTSKLIPIIRDAIRHLNALDLKPVLHPDVVKQLKERFAWKSGRDIRDYERAATVTQAVAWFHGLQREKNEAGQIIADEQDLEIVNGFIEPLLKTSRYGTSSEVLDYFERVLKPLAANGDIHHTDAAAKYVQTYDRIITRDELYRFNKVLESLGKIELVQDPADKRRRLIRLIQGQAQL
jgi:hypothetical protein